MKNIKIVKMNHLFVSYELALKLKDKGFDENCLAYYDINKLLRPTDTDYKYFREVSEVNIKCPLYQQVIDWLDSKNIHISIHPEFYKDGINWNWQVFEYDKNGKKDPISSRYSYTTNRSTMLYGDNGEYPKRMDAVRAAIEEALKLI